MGDISIRKALDDYKTVYMAYRNFADRTREEYLNDLGGFLDFLEKLFIKSVSQLSLRGIQRYVAQLEEKGFSSLTRKRKVVSIRSFLQFLYQDGYIETNIAKIVVLPYTESKLPNILTQKECDKLRETCAGSPRDRAIIELLLQTGIKLSELVHLTVNDIEIGEAQYGGSMRVIARRGKKDRIIPLNTKASIALKHYLDIRGDAGSKVLFLNRFSKPLGESGVQKMLRKYVKMAAISDASVHTLRHTFGAQHLAKGTSTKTIQQVMGYKDSRSTSLYIALSRDMLKKELQTNSL
jgi:integrase/recombinase XerD